MSSKKGREEREDLIVGRHPDADVFLERSQEFLMRDEGRECADAGAGVRQARGRAPADR